MNKQDATILPRVKELDQIVDEIVDMATIAEQNGLIRYVNLLKIYNRCDALNQISVSIKSILK